MVNHNDRRHSPSNVAPSSSEGIGRNYGPVDTIGTAAMAGVRVTSSSATAIVASQAWAILHRHAQNDIAPLRLQELCNDPDRVASLVAVHNTNTSKTNDKNNKNSDSHTARNPSINRTWIVDLSRQRMTDVTLNHLFTLAASMDLKKFIREVAWGPNNPENPSVSIDSRKNGTTQHPSEPIHMPMMLDTTKIHHLQQRINTTFSHDTYDHLSPSSQNRNNGSQIGIPSMHLALRVPADKGYRMYDSLGNNVLTEIHQTWHRIERFSDSVRLGLLKSATGNMICDVVVVGRGVAVAALEFLYHALLKDERACIARRFGLASNNRQNPQDRLFYETKSPGSRNPLRLSNLTSALQTQPASATSSKEGRRMKFITSVDPITVADVVADLDPGSTLVVTVAMTGAEEACMTTLALKNWLVQSLVSKNSTTALIDSVLAKHMILVTGNPHAATTVHKPESVYVLPENARCEPFTTFGVATLLPLSVVFGWSVAEELLAGAHDMDSHFVETNPRHNLPVLLALTDVWNHSIMKTSPRVLTPFAEALRGFPSFVGSLESQTCNCSIDEVDRQVLGTKNQSASSVIVDGGVAGSFDRALFQSDLNVNSELITVMNSQLAFNTSSSRAASSLNFFRDAQDSLMCSFFAHADELAFGMAASEGALLEPSLLSPSSPQSVTSTRSLHVTHHSNVGNRPSVLLACDKLDAFACGQLIALSEHRSVVKACIWGTDPFGLQEIGTSLRMERTDELKMELDKLYKEVVTGRDDDGGEDFSMILSTKTLLGHYANLMKVDRN